tara:strand:+ start:32 stop:1225 length:1194 start_codon:yes stop_codon:yes gene_type:complete
MPYLGQKPKDTFTASASQTITGTGATSYSLNQTVTSPEDVEVFINNVQQQPTVAYTVSGQTITFDEALLSTDSCYVVFRGARAESRTHPAASNLQARDVTATNVNATTVTPTNLNATNVTVSGAFTSQGIDDNADATAITIDSSEQVGIGTSAPSANLEISSGAPTLILNANTQASNLKKVRLATSQVNAGDFRIQTMQDDGTTLQATRFVAKADGSLVTGGNNFIDQSMSGGNSDSAFNVSGLYGSGTRFNWFQPSFYGTGQVNRTYRKCFHLTGDNCWVYFTGGGGNTVFGTYAYITAQHYRDVAVWSVTLYYSDLKIKVVTDGNANKTVYVAGDTYQDSVYALQWRVFPIHSGSTITMNPSTTESNGYLVHHASGGEQFTGASSLTSGTGPSTY